MKEKKHDSQIVSLRIQKDLKSEVDEVARLLKIPATNLWRMSVAEKCVSVRALFNPDTVDPSGHDNEHESV